MKIHHLALWTNQLMLMRDFYSQYFGFRASSKYCNSNKAFESYFLSDSEGVKLELMSSSHTEIATNSRRERQVGWAHLAISVGSELSVEQTTEKLRNHGYLIVSEPRLTGDGYYESCVADPDGNLIEITV